jgi:hypothetical protein
MKQCAAGVVLGIRRIVHGTFARDGLGIRRQWVKDPYMLKEYGHLKQFEDHFIAQ